MKTKKKVITGLLALTFATGTYVLTGCEDTDNEETMSETVYSIKYHLNGGTNDSSNPETYKASDETFSLKNAIKEGYTFAGWYEESTFVNQVTTIEQGDKGHIDLYAKFVPHTYTITYELNGGVLSKNNPESYDVTTETISINNPTKEGYTFVGWKDEDTGTIVQFRKILKGSMGNRRFSAQWELTTYKITTISNYGDINIVDGANHGDEITFVIEPNPGYEVVEIRINDEIKDATTTSFTMPGEDVTLEVIYKASEYTITYNLDGGVNSSDNRDTYDIETLDFDIAMPTKEGYHFMGWRDESTQQVSRTFTIIRGTTGNKTYTALWSVNSYNIGFTADHGTIAIPYSADYGSTVEFTVYPDMGYSLTKIIMNGEEINATSRSFVMPAGDVELQFIFERDVYPIEYVLNGGTNDDRNPATFTVNDALNIYDAKKDGYTFMGWYVDEECTRQFTGGYMSEPLTLYAKFAQASIAGTYYETVEEAIDAAEFGDIVQILSGTKISNTITIEKQITLRGEDADVSVTDNFEGAAMFIVEGNVHFEGLNLDARGQSRVIRVNSGNLVLYETDVTGGYSNSYIAGVYVTGKSTFAMYGGSIKGNTIAEKQDYLEYATDLWIGSQASGTVAIIDENAEIGNVFVNANSYKSEDGGILSIIDGTVENVYVEYDEEQYAVFEYTGGSVDKLMISTKETGNYVTIHNPEKGIYRGGHTIYSEEKTYLTLNDAIAAAESGDVIKVMGETVISEQITINKDLTIVGYDATIKTSEYFNGAAMFVIEGLETDVKFDDIRLDANLKSRVIRANAGHLNLTDTIVTGGYSSSYIAGVYVTGYATFEMHGGSIVDNTIEERQDYLRYATDLWIGSQASGEVATIDTDAEIGNVFVNANSYKTETGGKFVLDGGTISNVYVEYEDSYYGVFEYVSGYVETVILSTNKTGTFITVNDANFGTYKGGHTIYGEEKTYLTLNEAISAAESGDTIRVLGEAVISEQITINKDLTIVGYDGTIKTSEYFTEAAMFIIEGSETEVKFEDIRLDARSKSRVIRANAGHLNLTDTIVTGGYSGSYVAGVYVTGYATFEMHGGSIVDNTIEERQDYLRYATDLWIGSQASGEVATIDTDAEIGNVFVNANSYKTETGGKFVLDGGTISNVYVEYEDSYYGVFEYVSGYVGQVMISTTTTGKYGTLVEPEPYIYRGGHTIWGEGEEFTSLAEAVEMAQNNGTIWVLGETKVDETIYLNKNLDIIGEDNGTVVTSENFNGAAMFIIEGSETEVKFEDIRLDANLKSRVIRANAGHLNLTDTIVTGGYSSSYIAGVYVTGYATFEMHGGSIIGNTIEERHDYLMYATDLWIGSQARGVVATVDADAEIGSVFVNSNSYKTHEGGRFEINGGIIENVYVEYEAEKGAVVVFAEGVVRHMRLSTTTTGEYTTYTGDEVLNGIYVGGTGYIDR